MLGAFEAAVGLAVAVLFVVAGDVPHGEINGGTLKTWHHEMLLFSRRTMEALPQAESSTPFGPVHQEADWQTSEQQTDGDEYYFCHGDRVA